MAQQDLATIDLEPIGGRKVTARELERSFKTIWNEIQSLRNNSTNGAETDGTQEENPKPPASTDALKRYALYGIGGVVAVYLIGKALQ